MLLAITEHYLEKEYKNYDITHHAHKRLFLRKSRKDFYMNSPLRSTKAAKHYKQSRHGYSFRFITFCHYISKQAL